ncbi:hypothetical protein [Moorena sp. SIO3E8]|uniref:hypothetical protein n=1 Tax=Moorena sp. SIO3E8 TaxID=2607830 RepID=UPI001418BA32|nr:hypothetical protein [Moorena sp. SIO3E8]NEO14337.1 hypothetical protein [Moorena sp. SIO3E8]
MKYIQFSYPDSRLPTPDSRLPTPDSRLPTPDSRLPKTPRARYLTQLRTAMVPITGTVKFSQIK